MRVAGEPAFLAIADVTGYTGYLAGVELDHATDILADLIATVVEALEPFRLAKLEGDAAFVHLGGDSMDPSLLQDRIEGTYLAFRTRLRDIGLASSCECDACIRIPALDLKLVVHHGLIARQRMLGSDELVGADVIVVHRLLKNRVTDSTGFGAYALYSQAAIDAAGIDPAAQAMREHHESTDVAGDVRCWTTDLAAVWEAHLHRPRSGIPPELVARRVEVELPVPPAIAWEYLTSPARRPAWSSGIDEIIELSSDGRRGVGTTNHCMHGKDAVIERILDWRPPTWWLTRSSLPEAFGGIDLLMSDELVEVPVDRTLVTVQIAPADDTDPERFASVADAIGDLLSSMTANLATVLEDVARDRAADRAGDPAVPASQERFLTSPIQASADREGLSPV